MSEVRHKVHKERSVEPDALEESVAHALVELEQGSSELKDELQEIYIVGAKEIDVGSRQVVVIFVPFRLQQKVHSMHTRLVRELEKKFSGKHVLIVAQRRIIRRERKGNRLLSQKRPRSRTLTAVHQATLEDIVYPTGIVGMRTRFKLDGGSLQKVHLDPREKQNVEYKIETFQAVYKKLTGKDVVFEFPIASEK
eukprot:Plantae.Rhodophyta-Purpureofilum_apyrenoidigerum.ctg16071.p1 GENE.Plantae.Rhodophyta-Purpureofilum_apyrenoidigerum.ctg16071~~Plantae.Rhodophyta-Purpureofilum_apyrenoidigerum.ctg16071.p1  ORF type:complete len:224 (+),score=57.38 Plantae.Rhodophyta-Purpureofilum_apyrenoidigerum.ctg16071:90-674(+)